MDESRLKQLLESLAAGETTVGEAIERLRVLPFEDMEFAKIDHHRSLRRGFPETVFCEGKTAPQIVEIARRVVGQGTNLLATRCSASLFADIAGELPDAVYHEEGRLFFIGRPAARPLGEVAVVSGGTSDRPVAEEAALTAGYLGCAVDRIHDVGVAGIHRLFSHIDRIRAADVIVVVAGMEGALASVVAGVADSPIVAVPTSVGYGASFGGLSALLTMLNSCAGGVTVVNIDNGYGAGYAAAVICRTAGRARAGKGKTR
ncbi:MAG: nickel pincer cofactor biosynthesis protein LarB [Candidatus Krumholzibacteriota bacterium]|nr:nickel pincer cofactor biosynthesis protein LarB [Candidatus Krumholzibacteriota bacterium]